MARHTLPSLDYLRQCFELDIESGSLTWKARPREHFPTERGWLVFLGAYAGKRADHLGPHGYRRVSVDGDRYAAHRIVWKMVHGTDPETIDHINRDRSDNRPSNLRSCTEHENALNRPMHKNNRCGVKGVHACNGKWRAMIRFEGRSRHIGLFETLEEASAAYKAEAARLFGEFASP